ncbi:MAG TPA: hypothetical protein VKX45_21725 [Bryobacteraceae bacterium]|nr:hypothetical protein [Bryobacteraceae bacterium]
MLPLLLALLRFTAWEAVLFAAAGRLAQAAGWSADDKPPRAERWLAVLGIQVALEATVATTFSLLRLNSQTAYWIAAAVCAGACMLFRRGRGLYAGAGQPFWRHWAAAIAAISVPAILVSFRPIQEIDSVNYLHYLIEWMGNHGSVYDFASYYSPFWEISFLPVWTVTGVDLFFPLLALKGVALVALAAWVLGLDLEIPPERLAWIVPSIVLMRHYWLEYSGVATIKNDAPQGAGFLLLALAVMRAARRPLERRDLALLATGVAFGTVKFLGVVTAPVAVAAVLWLTAKQSRDRTPAVGRVAALMALCFLLSTGHYYLHNWLRFGNPVYPMPLALGPLRLPGEGSDISYTSILYSLHDARLWRAFFWPAGAVSPLGALFPAIFAAALAVCAWRLLVAVRQRRMQPGGWLALVVLSTWLLYFRAPWSASAGRGDLAYILNSLDSVRLVDGVLAASELLVAATLGRWAIAVAAVNGASRLWLIAERLPADRFPPLWVLGAAALAGAAIWIAGRRALPVAAAALIVACPWLVERNRAHWTEYWNDLKPMLAALRGPDLAVLAFNEGCYFAGHVVAAGNPVEPSVRARLPEEMDAMSPASRPRYLAVLATPGFDWRPGYAAKIAAWGYRERTAGTNGAVFEKSDTP